MKKIERDCDNCIRKIPGSGCSSWDCDPITRQEAIDAVEAQRKLRLGRWIFDEDGLLRCSECELIPINKVETHNRLVYEIKQITKYMRFCPRCGAKMEVSE